LPVSYSILSGPAMVTNNILTVSGAGSVTIQASQSGNSNWNAATPVSQTISVAQKTVTGSFTANTRQYNGSTNASIANLTLAGVINADVVTLSAAAVSFGDKNVGNGKTVIATGLSLGGANAGNYVLASTFATNSANITPATLTVTANNTNRIYGAQNPAFTAGYSGFATGDSSSVLSGAPSLTTAATTNSSVAGSPYSIVAAQGTLSAANYTFSFVNGTLTVTPAALMVTANDTNRTYGASNPAFTASYSGFVNGEGTSVLSGAPSLTTTATASSSVSGSPYSIVAAQGTLSAANYGFSFTNGNLSITPAALTVSADNKSRPYGTTNPVLTASYTGFVNGEDTNVLSGSPSLSTSADTNSSPGTYTIQIAAGTLSATNYSLSLVNGTLTVDSLPSILSIQYVAGSPNAVIVSASGLVPTSTYHVLASTDLQAWSEIGTAQSTAGGAISYTNSATAPAQFYRIYGP
jgi:hypothetical protein